MREAAANVVARLERLRDLHEDPVLLERWTRVVEPFVRRFPPERRRRILSVASLWVLFRMVSRPKGWEFPPVARHAIVAPALLALCAAVFLAARHFDRLPRALRRRPQIALHAA